MHRHLISGIAAALAAASLAGCGSSSSTSSTASSSTASTSASSSAAASASSTTAAGAAIKPAVAVHTRSITRHIAGVAGRPAKGVRPAALKVPAKAGARPHVAGLTGLSLPQKLTVLFDDITPFWQQVFQSSQLSLPPVNLQLVGDTPFSCGTTQLTSTSGPGYCSGTPASIILPLGTMQTDVEPLGDSAMLLLESDFYSEHVATTLGYTSDKGLSETKLEELYSCLSGGYFAWAQGAQVQGQPLIGGADEQGVNNLIAQQGAQATSAGGPTAQDLTDAFNTGANSGLKTCLSQAQS